MKSKRPRSLLMGIAAAAALLAGVALWRLRPPRGDERQPLPPPLAVVADSVPASEFVGAQTCAACHAQQYAAWSASTHGRAGSPPSHASLLRDFDGQPIVFSDARVYPRRSGTEYRFEVEWGAERSRLVVEGVIGRAHMMGGGTQAFVWRHPDGSLRVLPFEIEGDGRRWFCNTETRANRGWAVITPEMSITDCGDWPPVRLLGSTPRYASCQECHASQVSVSVTPAEPLRTDVRSYAIDCEACHGPARRHVAAVRQGAQDSLALRPLTMLRADESLEVCFRCHALKDDVRPGFLAGARLRQHYSLKLALLGSAETFADGRSRSFAYQQSHLYSDCYRASGMTCGDCHDSHAQNYRDLNGAPLQDRFDDQQCTACHPSKAVEPARHTKHAAGTDASRCVTCHMPYQQQPAVGNQIRYGRSDHTIGIPRPRVDAANGITVACAGCHRERSAAALQADVDRLWGPIKPRREVLSRIDAARDDPRALRDIVVADTATTSMEFYDALARYLVALRIPDEGGLDRKVRRRLQALASSEDDEVAALALATLHFADGEFAKTRAFLVRALRGLGARDAPVRERWAIALAFMGDQLRSRGDAGRAVTTYRKVLEVTPAHAQAWNSLGLALLDGQQVQPARDAFRRALELDVRNSLSWVNLGIALARQDAAAEAEAAYRRALQVNPYEPLAYFNLGNLAFRAGDLKRAIEHYQRAVQLDPALAAAHLNLARAYAGTNQLTLARAALQNVVWFDRDDQEARAALQQLDAQLDAQSRVR